MILSSEQRKVACIDQNAFVTACPGAGKTRVVSAKIEREIGAAVSAGREIACITYTNAACQEILTRTSASLPECYLQAVRISTLHGFLLESVLKPWHHLLTPFSTELHLASPEDARSRSALRATAEYFGVTPESLQWTIGHYWRDIDGSVISQRPAEVNFFIQELDSRAAVDFEGILYYSHRLIADFKPVRQAIGHRYSWILVDEYQDFNPTSLAIFQSLASCPNPRVFYIGDLGQAIYDFKGATREKLEDCADKSGAIRMRLSETYRCGRKISAAASRLQNGLLHPVEKAATIDDKVDVKLDSAANIISHFIETAQHFRISPERLGIVAARHEDVESAIQLLKASGIAACRLATPDRAVWLRTLLSAAFAAWRDFNVESLERVEGGIRDSLELTGLDEYMACAISPAILHRIFHQNRSTIDLTQSVKSQTKIVMHALFHFMAASRILSPELQLQFEAACRTNYKELLRRL